ncbi:phage holin family protein [Patescibacteria group bacterium]|nr:phage holin family protein [Patescibacteria group bacterium]
MKWIGYFLLMIIVNAMVLIVSANYIHGFYVNPDLKLIFGAALILTIINIFVRPILKLILSPVVFLTLGLGIILVNGLVIYLLDILSPNIKIEGLLPLLYVTLIFSAVNFIFHLATKKS